tara:strand:- start:243 stop:602 length:360 start_codon:yes stop_codon:yes gene_type:complete
MSASYDKVTGLPTFYKYVPTEPPQEIIALNYDIMNEIGKAVKLRNIEIIARNNHNLLMNSKYFTELAADFFTAYYQDLAHGPFTDEDSPFVIDLVLNWRDNDEISYSIVNEVTNFGGEW